MIQTDTKYYIYHHINLDTNEIFYVGKGSGSRYNSVNGRSKFWMRYVKKNKNYECLIVTDGLSEEQAFELERYEIERIGRRVKNNGTLVNILPGGVGFPEHYITYRDELIKEIDNLPELDESNTKLIKREKERAIINRLVDKAMEGYVNPFDKVWPWTYSSNNKKWSELSYDEKLQRLADEHNEFFTNFKVGRKWAKDIRTDYTIKDLSEQHIKKMFEIKERYER